MKKQKYYVVWSGNRPGIYESWADCKAQVHGVKGAVYKSFDSRNEADKAFNGDPSDYVCRKKTTSVKDAPESSTNGHAENRKRPEPSINKENVRKDGMTWCVDAACSGNPGKMEYRGVEIPSHRQIFHFGPVHGTNNIGEFLAIVHALALAQNQGIPYLCIYSDSRNAINWVLKKKCNTRLARDKKTEALHKMIERAETWLKTHSFSYPVLKWNTREWGEIPADFGRK